MEKIFIVIYLLLLATAYTKATTDAKAGTFHHKEYQSPSVLIERRDMETLIEFSDYNIKIAKSPELGVTLFIDDDIQSSELDYMMYHEALVQPAMFQHPNPKKVMIGGGGEFLTACEILKHKSVERVDMIDIDGTLLNYVKTLLKDLHKDCWKDPRLNIIIDDAANYVDNFNEELYDVVIMDIVDPTRTPAVIKLYTSDFYYKVKERLLKKDGVFGTHCSALHLLNIKSAQYIRANVESVFGKAYVYGNMPPSFQEVWGYLVAGNVDPNIKKGNGLDEEIRKRGLEDVLKFYDEESHAGMFGLPKNIRKLVYDPEIKAVTKEELNGVWVDDFESWNSENDL